MKGTTSQLSSSRQMKQTLPTLYNEETNSNSEEEKRKQIKQEENKRLKQKENFEYNKSKIKSKNFKINLFLLFSISSERYATTNFIENYS